MGRKDGHVASRQPPAGAGQCYPFSPPHIRHLKPELHNTLMVLQILGLTAKSLTFAQYFAMENRRPVDD